MQDGVKLTCLSCGQVNRIPTSKLELGPKCAKCGTGLLSGEVAAIGQRLHEKATQMDDLPLVVDYWAPWCGPCKMMAPEFALAAKTLRVSARFAKIDTEKCPAISQRLQIRGIPLLILFANGAEVARLPGARPASDIESFVRQSIR